MIPQNEEMNPLSCNCGVFGEGNIIPKIYCFFYVAFSPAVLKRTITQSFKRFPLQNGIAEVFDLK